MELVAIHTALTTLASHDLIGIFTDFLSSLQAMRHYNTNLGTRSLLHYHPHMILLGIKPDLLETIRSAGFRTTIHEIRAHTNIRGNDLADAAAKIAVTHFETQLLTLIIRVNAGGIAPRPTH